MKHILQYIPIQTHTQSNHITQKRQNIKLKKTKQQKISYPCVTARTQKKTNTNKKLSNMFTTEANKQKLRHDLFITRFST